MKLLSHNKGSKKEFSSLSVPQGYKKPVDCNPQENLPQSWTMLGTHFRLVASVTVRNKFQWLIDHPAFLVTAWTDQVTSDMPSL